MVGMERSGLQKVSEGVKEKEAKLLVLEDPLLRKELEPGGNAAGVRLTFVEAEAEEEE